TSYNMIAHGWQGDNDHRVIVVNLSSETAQGIIQLNRWEKLERGDWVLQDVISDESYERTGTELVNDGLYISLPPHGFHLFRFEPIPPSLPELVEAKTDTPTGETPSSVKLTSPAEHPIPDLKTRGFPKLRPRRR
ncbi:MAG: hypothetical protein AAF125_25825, partial [Chloroflexota bacterium]